MAAESIGRWENSVEPNRQKGTVIFLAPSAFSSLLFPLSQLRQTLELSAKLGLLPTPKQHIYSGFSTSSELAHLETALMKGRFSIFTSQVCLRCTGVVCSRPHCPLLSVSDAPFPDSGVGKVIWAPRAH
jgi:hypothetical protein